MSTNYKIPHPGKFLWDICLKPLNLTISQAAKKLDLSHKELSDLLRGKINIDTKISLKLAKAFNTIPESWLIQQMQYDLYKARNENETV